MKLVFYIFIKLLAQLQAAQLSLNVLWLQALADVVRPSSWTLAMAVSIAASIQTVLLIRHTAANIGRQAFAVVAAGAKRHKL